MLYIIHRSALLNVITHMGKCQMPLPSTDKAKQKRFLDNSAGRSLYARSEPTGLSHLGTMQHLSLDICLKNKTEIRCKEYQQHALLTKWSIWKSIITG